MTTYWSSAPNGGLPDPSAALTAFLPDGWLIHRQLARRWWVYGPHRRRGPATDSAVLVGELSWIDTHTWAVFPVGEDTPWPTTYGAAVTALDALIAWWNATPGPDAPDAPDPRT